MKITFLTSLLLIASMSHAQTASKDLSVTNSKTSQSASLELPSKKTSQESRDLSVSKKDPAKATNEKQQSQTQKSEQAYRLGSEGVGGGNGVVSANGDVIPLDVYFSQQNKEIDVKKAYPVAYKAFQKQVEKIRKAIPSFAKDIEETFSSLQWTSTNLSLNDRRCLNNTGVFKMRAGDKQVAIACQDDEGGVALSRERAQNLYRTNPDYLGVVFLHESFVKKMLAQYSGQDYSQAELKMITKVVPYIISTQTLDPAKLYNYAGVVGYLSLFSYEYKYNKYSLEAFPEIRAEYEKSQAEAAAIRALVTQGDDLMKQVYNDQLDVATRTTTYLQAIDLLEEAEYKYEQRANDASLTEGDRAQAAADYLDMYSHIRNARSAWNSIADRMIKADPAAQK